MDDDFEIADYEVALYGAEQVKIVLPLQNWIARMASTRNEDGSLGARNAIASFVGQPMKAAYGDHVHVIGAAIVVRRPLPQE